MTREQQRAATWGAAIGIPTACAAVLAVAGVHPAWAVAAAYAALVLLLAVRGRWA